MMTKFVCIYCAVFYLMCRVPWYRNATPYSV